jgi:hypothetical protein
MMESDCQIDRVTKKNMMTRRATKPDWLTRVLFNERAGGVDYIEIFSPILKLNYNPIGLENCGCKGLASSTLKYKNCFTPWWFGGG